MASPTTCKIGQFSWTQDSLVAHPASPTGAVLDLNDGTVFTLLDTGQALGEGLALSPAQPKSFYAGNPRTTGKVLTRRVYEDNRQIMLRLDWNGRGGTYATWITNMHNLVQLIEGITTTQPACLQLQSTGSAITQYADVLEGFVAEQYKELLWAQQIDSLTVVFTVRPLLRRNAVVLENLAMNPGFEAPAGGGATTTAPVVFNDTFANVNAYSSLAGSAPTTGPNQVYVDNVFAVAAPLVYFRLDEASGTTVYDISGNGKHGTTHGSPTQGVTSLLTGDSDTCYTFAAGSSQYVSSAATTHAGGNAALSMECRFKYASAPGTFYTLMSIGNNTNKQGVQVYIDSAGKLNADIVGGGGVTSAGAVSTGANHTAGVSWDGTTLTLYLDGASVGTPTTPGALSLPATPVFNVGSNPAPGNYYSGQLDETKLFGSALTAGNFSTLHTAANTGASGTLSGAMSIPAAARVGFGSPAWGAINTWQQRFRFTNGATYGWYLHRTDANNYLEVTLTGTALTLKHDVASSITTIQTTAPFITRDAWYWIKITQFPAGTANSGVGVAPCAAATLYYDQAGAIGSAVASGAVAGATASGSVAVVGAPQMEATTGAMIIGGNYSNVQSVALFGPGGWTMSSSGTGTASGAWESARPDLGGSGNATAGTNTYPNGPITSFYAARMDAAPLGTFSAQWRLYAGGTAAGTSAVPLRTVGDVIYVGVQAKSSGLANNATIQLNYTEWDASGSSLRTGTLQTFTVSGGVQAAWASSGSYTLSGHWTTGASCAYIDIQILGADTTSGSANGTIWIDNVQVWNSTYTGSTTASYHELRFQNSPVNLLVSGIVGDVPAPAMISVASYGASVQSSGTLYYVLGRRASSSLIPPPPTVPFQATTPALDTSSFGGWYDSVSSATYTSSVLRGQTTVMTTSVFLGAYELYSRAYMTDATTTRVSVQPIIQEFSNNSANTANNITGGTTLYPFSAASTWTVVDAGRVNIPAATPGALTDLTTMYGVVQSRYSDSGGATTWRVNYQALIPVDGGIGVCSIQFTAGGTSTYPTVYFQGFNYGPAYAYGQPGFNQMSTSLPLLTAVIGAAGSVLTGSLNRAYTFNSLADPWLTVDPTVNAGTTLGVNEFVAHVYDSAAAVYPAYASVRYSPLDLYFR